MFTLVSHALVCQRFIVQVGKQVIKWVSLCIIMFIIDAECLCTEVAEKPFRFMLIYSTILFKQHWTFYKIHNLPQCSLHSLARQEIYWQLNEAWQKCSLQKSSGHTDDSQYIQFFNNQEAHPSVVDTYSMPSSPWKQKHQVHITYGH